MRDRIAKIIGAVPFKFFFLMLAVLGVMQEWYPFSHFPMYSRFQNYTYYVYVTDPEGNPLPIETLFGIRTSSLKKIYDKELRRIAQNHPKGSKSLRPDERREAGDYALRFLRENSLYPARTNPITNLQLHQVDIRGVNGRIEKEVYLVGEI